MHNYSCINAQTLSQICIAPSTSTHLTLCAGEAVDEQTAQEETEDKLKQCIDNLMDKRYQYAKIQQSAIT